MGEKKVSSSSPKGIDWQAATLDYASSRESYASMAEKLGCSRKIVENYAKKFKWRENREKHRSKTLAKALDRASSREAAVLAKEFEIADAISNVLKQALKDAQQFNKHLVQVRTKYAIGESWDVEERIFDKVDMDALNKAAKTLETVEKVKRSIGGILTVKEKHSIDIDKQRLEIEKGKAKALGDTEDDETGVVMLPSIDE